MTIAHPELMDVGTAMTSGGRPTWSTCTNRGVSPGFIDRRTEPFARLTKSIGSIDSSIDPSMTFPLKVRNRAGGGLSDAVVVSSDRAEERPDPREPAPGAFDRCS